MQDQTCFAIALITADPDSGVFGVNNVGIENCVAVSPATIGPAVAFHIGPKEDLLSGIETYGKVPFIRNCFVDFGSLDATVEHRAFSMGWCLGGVLEGNQAYNVKYGGRLLPQASSRDFSVRNNFCKD